MPVTLLLPAKYLNFSAPLQNLFFSKSSNKIDEKPFTIQNLYYWQVVQKIFRRKVNILWKNIHQCYTDSHFINL